MRVLLFVLLSLLLPAGQVLALAVEYQAGTHYIEVANPIEVNSVEGQRGEIMVFFKYTCPGCYQFHPFVEAWQSTLDESVVVKKVPVFQPDFYSKAYYAADILNLSDAYHLEVYQQIHQAKKPLRSIEEFARLASRHGADEQSFLSTANSFAVSIKVSQGVKAAGQAQVPGTPFVLVNGKYLLSGRMLGSNERMLDVADYLLSRDTLAGPN